ncbi:MAG: nicotinamide n-methyltransferase [Bathelium mastoideum]|nr:MAG: nicotinamide n-methyltransferase [Bathelium mastoideum]
MSEDDFGIDMFKEPDGFYEAEKPHTTETHTMISGKALTLRLVGHSPLWGHLLFNAGRVISHYVEERADAIVNGKDVLELGAGAGAPSLVCALKGARTVVSTDYPDTELIENLRWNMDHCSLLPTLQNIHVEGYIWGNSPKDLLVHLGAKATRPGFDLILLSDLVFNHSEHTKLVKSIQQTLRRTPDAQALVFFTPHRTWLLQQDMKFFELAGRSGFEVRKVYQKAGEKVMFEEDKGVRAPQRNPEKYFVDANTKEQDEVLRRTVFGFELRWKELCCGGFV